MLKERPILKYCIRRPRPNCKVKTYNKHSICSSCQADLQELVNDIKMAEMLELKPEINYD